MIEKHLVQEREVGVGGGRMRHAGKPVDDAGQEMTVTIGGYAARYARGAGGRKMRPRCLDRDAQQVLPGGGRAARSR
ncbi:hypothetical protein GCM10027612_25090 [Microbispora bryophytorum subsp. camponoti]